MVESKSYEIFYVILFTIVNNNNNSSRLHNLRITKIISVHITNTVAYIQRWRECTYQSIIAGSASRKIIHTHTDGQKVLG